MHLWNDYEGKVIAEAYPLKKLLRPEGRSAFFITQDSQGSTEVIRLTEAINDEEEMLERWRQVAEVHQVNLVTIKKFGQTTFDGVPLAYALMELTDGNLAEILKERPLTLNETVEVATSVVAALGALHATELIHEHIEPANILATGDVIKLRSDCVRECRADMEVNPLAQCAELKQRDVRDLAVLLMQCLTLERKWQAGMKLPAPFDRIVPKGMDGSWGLGEIRAALTPAAVPVVRTLVPESVLADAHAGVAAPRVVSSERPAAAVAGQVAGPVSGSVSGSGSGSGSGPVSGSVAGPALHVRRSVVGVEPVRRSLRFWLTCAGAAIVLLLLVWLFLPTKEVTTPETSARAAEGRVPVVAAPVVAAPAASAPVVTARAAVSGPAALAEAHGGWRVVAFTYNHKEQAIRKVATVRRKHAGLRPEVFAPRAGAPYLVTLGGVMTRGEAEALRDRARRQGMPRDTFARNY